MKYNDLAAAIKTPVFSRQDLLIQGLKVYDYQFNLWTKKGYLLKIKKGLYVFAKDADKVTPQEIAVLLCEPSYISMETALAWYGFIPEMVYAHTSGTAIDSPGAKNDNSPAAKTGKRPGPFRCFLSAWSGTAGL
ncbi:MAG: hypothetical protein AB7Y74_15775 [Syntrophorhabdus sp.]|jgi:hypothetical protein